MLVYQGIALGSLTVGPMLKHVSPRRATQASLILNTGATFAFGGAQSATMLLIFRFLIGFLQAVPAVYFPVWVDEFAPADSSTLWMAVIQAGAPLGIMLGYVFCGAVTVGLNSAETECLETDLFCGWRIPFYAQSCVLVCFSIASFFLPKELYDLGHDKLGNVMPPALDAMDEESAMPPDGAIPPAVDPSLNETSSTKLRNTELRGSTVPELPTINLSPDPSAVALRDRTPSTGMTPGRGRTLSEYWADTNPFFNARHTIDNSSSFSLPSREVPAVSASASGSSACPTPNSSFSGSTRSVAMSIDSATGRPRSRSRSVSGRCATPSCTAEDAASGRPRVVSAAEILFGGATDDAPFTRLSSNTTTRQTSSSSGSSSHGGSHRHMTPRPPMSTIQSSTVLVGESGDLPALKTNEVELADVDDEKAPPEKRRLSRDFDADTAGPVVAYGDDAEGNGKKEKKRRIPLLALLGNPVYCCTVCALASLFFVVTGIQFWVTPYVIKVIGKPQEDITVAFGLTSITAPIIGVFMGGTIIDKLGGYKGNKALARTLFVCTVNAVLAASSAALTAFVPLAAKDSYVAANASDPVEVAAAADAGATAGFFLTIGLIFATLVFGGAIIPAATGVLVSSVDPSLRQLSSAAAIFFYQQFGYALSCLLPGVLSSIFTPMMVDEQAELDALSEVVRANATLVEEVLEEAHKLAEISFCFKVVMFWGAWGVIGLTSAWLAARRKLAREGDDTEDGEGTT